MTDWFTDMVLRATLKVIPHTRNWRGVDPTITHERTDDGHVVAVAWWSEDIQRRMSFHNYSVFEIAWFLGRLDWRKLDTLSSMSEEAIQEFCDKYPHARIRRVHPDD